MPEIAGGDSGRVSESPWEGEGRSPNGPTR